ncbi:unnamed protein product [Protopolystoma xenopodis]|uniref:Uncharacterized protein n=1 Tax=Protopolystoma xenopodis TaxID=117903 RepID=A0A448WMF1_9PLAT|nr:unnamed protein product [Protopolystoma xenopodis]
MWSPQSQLIWYATFSGFLISQKPFLAMVLSWHLLRTRSAFSFGLVFFSPSLSHLSMVTLEQHVLGS